MAISAFQAPLDGMIDVLEVLLGTLGLACGIYDSWTGDERASILVTYTRTAAVCTLFGVSITALVTLIPSGVIDVDPTVLAVVFFAVGASAPTLARGAWSLIDMSTMFNDVVLLSYPEREARFTRRAFGVADFLAWVGVVFYTLMKHNVSFEKLTPYGPNLYRAFRNNWEGMIHGRSIHPGKLCWKHAWKWGFSGWATRVKSFFCLVVLNGVGFAFLLFQACTALVEGFLLAIGCIWLSPAIAAQAKGLTSTGRVNRDLPLKVIVEKLICCKACSHADNSTDERDNNADDNVDERGNNVDENIMDQQENNANDNIMDQRENNADDMTNERENNADDNVNERENADDNSDEHDNSMDELENNADGSTDERENNADNSTEERENNADESMNERDNIADDGTGELKNNGDNNKDERENNADDSKDERDYNADGYMDERENDAADSMEERENNADGYMAEHDNDASDNMEVRKNNAGDNLDERENNADNMEERENNAGDVDERENDADDSMDESENDKSYRVLMPKVKRKSLNDRRRSSTKVINVCRCKVCTFGCNRHGWKEPNPPESYCHTCLEISAAREEVVGDVV